MNNSNMTPESCLKKYFGFSEFRSTQKEIIDLTLQGGHSLVIMPTGMGKSVCYQIPALLFDGLTIVISPLISLMKDQADSLSSKGIDCAYINSSLSKKEKQIRYENIQNGKYKLLYVSPERFRKKSFLQSVSTRKISLLALDEAHCISQWGNDFRPDYSRIGEFRSILGNPTTIALTATATREVQADIIRITGIEPEKIKTFNEGICRPNLEFKVAEVIDENEKFQILYDNLTSVKGSKIVYFNLIRSIEAFADYLDEKKIRYLIYHGKLPNERKRFVQKRFMESGSSLILATNAFGMGIDKSDIRQVIHAEVPDSVESYYQEIGRAGRDGKPSNCLLIYSQDDLAVQIEFLKWKNPDSPFIKTAYSILKSLGSNISSFDYEDIQEKIVFKNKGDHRLQTVLSIFDRAGITEGDLETGNLKLVGELDPELISNENIQLKMDRDKKRLIDMLNYVKTENCRREYIHTYFAVKTIECENCDNC